ncbi:glycosyltransferase [uncultured Bifidobacterium sp.]|uniref:glycosyltransferase n=1 Tax=uncultured Bifidobacterium sp. TaxID=165187 RepID=UPI0025E70270|nr:glycosyltransferase [uncultured Bifidobacterium sp.]
MRCLVFGLHDTIGGVERYVANVYPYLREKQVYFDFISPFEHMALEEDFQEQGCVIYHVPNFKKSPIGYFVAIDRILRKQKYDVVYVNMLSAANVLPFILAKRCRTGRVIAHSHNNDTPSGMLRKLLHTLNIKIVERISTDFWACSKVAGQWLFPDVSLANIRVVPDAIDMSCFRYSEKSRKSLRKQLQISDDSFVFGHVGRFEEQKNHEMLLKIFSLIRKKRANIILMLVGEGILMRKICMQAESMGISDSVRFVGAVSDVSSYYSVMDAFLFPSKFEGFGMAVIEAQTSGLSCLVSDTVPVDVDITSVSHLSLGNLTDWVEKSEELAEIGPVLLEDRLQRYTICENSKYSISRSADYLVHLFYSNMKGQL